MKVCYKW